MNRVRKSKFGKFKLLLTSCEFRSTAENEVKLHKLTPRLSGFEILNYGILLIQNWLVFKLFAKIFDYLKLFAITLYFGGNKCE